ncbi:hypothetical protein V2J09_002906 [Rumex salicifolius]
MWLYWWCVLSPMESSKKSESDERCDKQQEQQELGMDQLFEIFSWMPAKAVIRFSSLSKSLYSLVSKPSFVERQSVRSSIVDGGFFLHRFDRRFLPDLEFHALPPRGSLSTTGIPRESLALLNHTGYVLASSQGLLLLRKLDKMTFKETNNFFLCNPATGSCAPLAIPEWLKSRKSCYEGSILECDPHSTDYSVMIPINGAEEEDSHLRLAVYNKKKKKNQSWEVHTTRLAIDGLRLFTYMPLCLFRGGIIIHYLCEANTTSVGEEPSLMAYDVGMKAFSRKIQLPPVGPWNRNELGFLTSSLKMFKWKRTNRGGGETIGLVKIHRKGVNRMFTVWVLEDYELGFWRRLVHKTTAEMGVPEKEACIKGFTNYCCTIVNGTGLLFATETRVYLYHMEAATLEVVGEHGYRNIRLACLLYANTLRPL